MRGLKSLVIGTIIIGATGMIGCSSTDDFKEGFNDSYQSIVNKNMEDMYNTEKEAKEFADLLIRVGEDVTELETDEDITGYVDKTVAEIQIKIDKLAEESHPDAKLMIEGYTLMSESLIATKDGDVDVANILLRKLDEKAVEISKECRID